METKYKFYIVSFSDSRKFKLTVIDGDLSILSRIEKELNSYLKSLFPEQTFAYYTTPQVTEISYAHRDQYASYPDLDAKAVEEIKAELRKEVQIANDLRTDNSDAPFSQISATPAPSSH